VKERELRRGVAALSMGRGVSPVLERAL